MNEVESKLIIAIFEVNCSVRLGEELGVLGKRIVQSGEFFLGWKTIKSK